MTSNDIDAYLGFLKTLKSDVDEMSANKKIWLENNSTEAFDKRRQEEAKIRQAEAKAEERVKIYRLKHPNWLSNDEIEALKHNNNN